MIETPIASFANELDELVDKWAAKPQDDQVTKAEIVGCLMFKMHVLMAAAQEESD